MLNPVWLKTFVVLIDVNHFTKAAEKLFMTQSGVSQHIKKLESVCGHLLIKRDKKSFVITEQGRLVYNYGKRVAQSEFQLIEQLGFDALYSGECSIACSGSVALVLYPKLIALQSKYPELVIKLKAAPNHQILSEIKGGSIDVGIVTDISNHSFYDIEELGKEELCLIVPKAIDTQRPIETLLNQLGLISHPDAEHYLSLYCAQSTEEEMKRIDISRIPIAGAVNQISQILEPIAAGIGFTVLPKSALENFYNKHKLKVLTPKSPIIESLYFVKQKNRSLPARYKTIDTVLAEIW